MQYDITLSTTGTTYLNDVHVQDLTYTVSTADGRGGRSRAMLSNLQTPTMDLGQYA